MLLFFTLICGLILVLPRYDSFAWFTTQSFAGGKITNASTSDLLTIDVGEVQYLKNCNVQTSVSITNISNVDIPIQLKLLDSKHSKTKVLAPGQSLTSGKSATDSSSCEATQIIYHLLGFQGYIDENIVIPLSTEQMIKPVKEKEKEVKDEKVEEKENENKQEPVVDPEEDTKSTEQDQPGNEETPTEPTPLPEEHPETTDEENNQADTPASQPAETPAIESDKDV